MVKKNYEYTDEELAEIAIAHPDFKCPQFPLYINDVLGSTRIMMLSDLEFRAYFNLLFTEWGEKDCGLPTTVEFLVRLSRVGGSLSVDNMNNIKQFFFEYKGRLYNRRLLEERVKQIKKREINKNNINKRYEQPTKEPTIVEFLDSSSKGVSDIDNDIDNDKDFKKGGTGETEIIIPPEETELEPIESRKSKFGGPDYKSVENVFVAKNRPKEEAAIFWNEYESKEWCVHNKEGTGKRKITHNWRYKAENWICGAILEESENKNYGTKSKSESAQGPGYGRNSKPDDEKGRISKERVDGLAAKARGDNPP